MVRVGVMFRARTVAVGMPPVGRLSAAPLREQAVNGVAGLGIDETGMRRTGHIERQD